MLSIRVRNRCVCSAYASGPDAYAQHARQFLLCMLSMVCRDLYNERPFEKWKTDAYAEHTHQCISSWRVCSACAPVPCTYAQLAHQFLSRMLSLRINAGAYAFEVKFFIHFLSTSKTKNFKKSLLTLTNGLKSSIEKKILGPKLRKKNLLKNRLSIRVRNFAPLNVPPKYFLKFFYCNPEVTHT